ncbi:MAG TPA: glycosyltransferase [Solirubrobacteraceae bacterium]|nr:glycosyltransferase [Solirubrobacteraceae bacterium]
MAPKPLIPHDVVFYVPAIAPLLAGGGGLPPGGAETQVALIARALAARGARVAVVAFAVEGLPRAFDGVAVVPRAPHSGSPPREAAEIVRTLRRAPSRVVVTRQAGAHTGLVALGARLLRRRFVYSSANVVDFDFGSLERHPLKRALYELGVRLASEIVVQTDEQVELCRARYRRDPPRIRSIAEPARPRAGAGDAFLWVGRVVGYKQPLAYVELARAVPEATFRMVAVPERTEPELLAELRAAAAATPNLELLDPRPRPDVMALVERAVAVVLTSSSEGMPNVFLEGWVRGVPALTLAHDPDRIVERHGLGGTAHGSPERLAELARDLWARREELAELGERCRAYVAAEHSAEAVGAAWARALAL